ncbi:MAG: double-strand break repair helicase AddA [Pseudomonadota bacterium]
MSPNEATQRQLDAATPDRSTWVAANAGSGKTRVLTDRVARLLFGGVRPERILCLTYTRAAASEMQNRLFKRLGGWTMKPDVELRDELRDLGETEHLTSEDLRRARQMFATAIETPGGLKIQTIHSFCAGLLRQFPLEAGVSPGFREMDDRSGRLLRQDVVEELSKQQSGLVDSLARFQSAEGLESLLNDILKHRDSLLEPVDRDQVFAQLGLLPESSEATVALTLGLTKTDADVLRRLVSVLPDFGANDQKAAAKLAPIASVGPQVSDLPVLETVFLTGVTAQLPFTAKTGRFPTKPAQNAIAADLPYLNDFMERVERARDVSLRLAAAERTLALRAFAHPFLAAYEAAKAQRGWLDFDDLIMRTRELLSHPGVADWVLFRLDGGIDHVLVDEAQDTSPAQWDVVERLTQEFTSGEGARSDTPRTLFVVGDKKQSIYSFQGAAPKAFDQMRRAFGTRLESVGKPLQDVSLLHSFRSSPAILGFVDKTLGTGNEDSLGSQVSHIAFHGDLPGRVDVWPMLEKSAKVERPPFEAPVDQTPEDHEAVRLAGLLAGFIREHVEGGTTLPIDGATRRHLRYGDFLILVQRRSGLLFRELIRALKAAHVPIAGADTLEVNEELAVKDLVALLSFLATPEDDLSLAAALRSPLLGWSEDDLFRLAYPRQKGEFLWAQLRRTADDHGPTMAILRDLRDQSEYLRPYDLLERALIRHNGRKRLLARLGREAEEGIDALLKLALDYETAEIPNLTGFLSWLEGENVRVKRAFGDASDEVRVMTVHGAKGRESPVVILPDTHHRSSPNETGLVAHDGGVFWSMNQSEAPPELIAAKHDAEQKREEERTRLYYVAMTRAEKWLVIAGAGARKDDCWHALAETAARSMGATELETPAGPGMRWETGTWDARTLLAADRATIQKQPVPQWVHAPKTPRETIQPVLSPSDLGGAKALPGFSELSEEDAKARGSAIHLLLEHLPDVSQDLWKTHSETLLPDLPEADLEGLLEEAKAVMADPELRFLFADDVLAEVSLTAAPDALSGQRIRGTIDRLLIEPNRVLAVDFKTNAGVPERVDLVPEGILRQMGAYSAMLADVYPDRRIETAILWTRTALLMALPHEIVSAALARAATP